MCDKNNGDSPVVDVAARFILAHCTDDKDWLQEEILFTHTGCPVKLFPLGYLLFCQLLLIQISKVGTFFEKFRKFAT